MTVRSPLRASADIVSGGISPALARDWQALFQGGEFEPSTSLEWSAALMAHHPGRRDRVTLVHLRDDERTLGVIPLLGRSLRVLGQSVRLLTPVSELNNTHSDLLVRHREPGVLEAFVDLLFGSDLQWDCFRLTKLLEDAALRAPLEAVLRARGAVVHVRDGLPAYVLDLPPTVGDYLAARSAKFRSALKRIAKRVEAAGQPRVTVVRDAATFDAAYADLLAIERASWKEAHGTSISAVTRQTGFYRDMSRGALEAGRLHLQFLHIGGVPVAYDLGYLHAGCYSYLKTSYRADARALSPASYLRAHLVASLIEAGVRRLDFPGEPYEWERQWTEAVRWHKVLSVYRGPRGRVLATVDRLRHASEAPRQVRHLDPRAPGGAAGAG